jgi:hypothetical protein
MEVATKAALLTAVTAAETAIGALRTALTNFETAYATAMTEATPHHLSQMGTIYGRQRLLEDIRLAMIAIDLGDLLEGRPLVHAPKTAANADLSAVWTERLAAR